MIINDLLKRYLIFLLGIMINALGIAFIVKSNLGTPPITSVAYVLTFIFPFSLGVFTFIVNMLMILGQIIILKKDFPRVQYLQIVMTVIFSAFIDFFMLLLKPWPVEGYLYQILVLLSGCIILALGISLEVKADVLVLAGEGIVKVLAQVLEKEFGIIKTIFDVALVITSILLSLIFTGQVEGIREGTVMAAVSVGIMARYFGQFWESIGAAWVPTNSK